MCPQGPVRGSTTRPWQALQMHWRGGGLTSSMETPAHTIDFTSEATSQGAVATEAQERSSSPNGVAEVETEVQGVTE